MHFVLTAVTKPGQELDELMASYQENNMGNVDPRFLVFVVDEEKDDEGNYYYDEVNEDGQHGYVSNPEGRWDWWVVGGRWPDRLRTKSGAWVDSARAGDLDLDGMRQAARNRAVRKLAVYRDAVEAHGPVPDMAFFDGPLDAGKQSLIRAFWDHPTLQAMKTPEVFIDGHGAERTMLYQTFDLDDLTWIARSADGWVEGMAAGAIVGHDVLTHEGVWMGMYGDWRVDSYGDRLSQKIGFYEAAGAYLSNLDEDMVVTSVDYHN
jgi:hypothetical protein